MPTISRVKVGDVVYDLKDNDFSLENLSEHIPELIDGKVTESSIVAGSITSDKIASGAITTEKLAAESVTADQIAASAVTTEKLDAEAVTADQIAAGAITTEKLDAEAVTADKIETHTITADQIASHTITAEEIASHTITSDEISSHTIKSDNIMAGAITADEIAALSITTDKLAALAITTDKIAANAIEADNLAAGSVVAGKIAANAIEADNIQANAITTDKLDSQAVTAEKIESHSITADQIEAGTITATEIAAGAITSEEIAANTITADNIASSTITSDEIASHTIKSDNIMAGAITADEIASLAVTTDKLDALSITSDKIAAYAVEANNLAAGSVVAGKIAADAIEADNIQANAITTDKLASQAVTADKIKSHSITADQIEAETITADEIAADAITTEKIQAGAVNAGNIAANAITTDKIQAGAVKTNSIDSGAITTSKIAAGAITADSAIIADGAIGNAQISSAGIDYAKVKDLNASSAYFGDAIFEEAIGGKLYVPRLLFNTAQGRQMLVEDIIIGASNGNYYSLDITETDGVVSMTPTQVQVTSSEISNGHSTDGKAIIGTTATYDDLATTNLYAIDALIDTITAKRIDVDELWSREAFINKLMVQDISSNTYIQSTIGSWSATHTNTLTDEISGINRTIGELGRGQIFYSLTEPEDPSVGDLWIKPQLMTTWGSIGAFTWEELEEYKWIELGIPPKQFVYGNSGWESVNDSSMYTVLQTQLSQTDERINLKATQADLNLMNQRVSETEAQIDIHSGQITQEIVDRKNGDATAEQNAKDASIAKTAQYQTAQDIVSSVESWVGGELEDYSTSSQTSQEIALAVSGKNAIYRQASAPAGTTKNPLVAGDLWFDTSNGNTPKRYNGSTWVETGDTTKYTVQSGIDIKAAGIEISGGTYVKIKSGGSFSIDSSKFEIDASGNVKMEGEVRASSGSIGGWTINATSLTNSKVGLIKTSSDSAIAIYAGNATPASAAFHVTQGGALTATNATITGKVTATSGSIGGWTVSSTAITNGIVGLNTTLADSGISIYAGNETPASAPFRVTRGGALTAANATIVGSVTATSGSIGGWTINATSLTNGKVGLIKTSSDTSVSIYAGNATPASAPFRVTQGGALTATNATIVGSVTATSGSIGGWTINATSLTNGKVGLIKTSADSAIAIYAGNATPASAAFHVTQGGALTATDATIVGSVTATSGKIGGWTVSSTAITNGIVGLNTTLVNNGISIYAGNETPASAPFRVTRGGALTATNATITGKVTATSGSVGGWTIGSDWIGNGSSFLGSTVGMRSTSGDNVAIWAGHTSGQQMLPTTSKFSVTANGYLKSTSGDIGGWSISSNKLTSGNSSNYVALSTSGDYVMWAGSSDASNAPFRVKRDGTIYSTKLISLNEDGIENTIDIRDYSLWKLNYATVKSMSVSGNTLSITTTAGSITFRKAAYDQIEELTLSGTPSASSKRMLAHVVVSDSTSGQTFTMPDKVVDVSDAYNAGYNAALSDCGVPADRTSYTVYTGSESQVMIQGVGLKWVVSPYAGHAVSRK